VIRKVGIRNLTSFWKDPWSGETPFLRKYPRLYVIATNNEASVEELSRRGEWDLEWRRSIFVWEEELFISLKEDLEGHRRENF